MKLSSKAAISVFTVLFLGLILYLSRHELVHAWKLLGSVNPWILSLMIPIVLINYFSVGEMIFSYLRQKGTLKRISPFTQIRLTLEMNFVNHVMPSGGVSGMTYMTLRLSRYGISASKATMAQVVRIAVGFVSFFALLIVAVIMITLDGNVNRSIILVSSTLVSLIIGASVAALYFMWSGPRVRQGSKLMTRFGNRAIEVVTFGRKKQLLKEDKVEEFMMEMHDDFVELKRDQKILIQPFIWGTVYTVSEVALFFVAFWSLGEIVNPAPILIAFGLATIAGFAVATPGGTGPYEALMVGFLTVSGVTAGTALAGVILGRAFILIIILVPGYILYQHAVAKYGIQYEKPTPKR